MKFLVHTDVSNLVVEVMLVQNPTRKCDQPIAYVSKFLNNVEKDYTATKREALTMVNALQKFKYYLQVCFLCQPHGITIPCQETSTIGTNCKVAIVISKI
jgi:hypothetical protein